MLPVKSICTETKGLCWTERQIFFNAFCKMNKFFQAISKSISSIDQAYLYQVDVNLSKNGVSRFAFVIDDNDPAIKISSKKDTPIFKICVPTRVDTKSFIDFHCPLDDCVATYEESSKCKEIFHHRKGAIKVNTNLGSESKLHLVK